MLHDDKIRNRSRRRRGVVDGRMHWFDSFIERNNSACTWVGDKILENNGCFNDDDDSDEDDDDYDSHTSFLEDSGDENSSFYRTSDGSSLCHTSDQTGFCPDSVVDDDGSLSAILDEGEKDDDTLKSSGSNSKFQNKKKNKFATSDSHQKAETDKKMTTTTTTKTRSAIGNRYAVTVITKNTTDAPPELAPVSSSSVSLAAEDDNSSLVSGSTISTFDRYTSVSDATAKVQNGDYYGCNSSTLLWEEVLNSNDDSSKTTRRNKNKKKKTKSKLTKERYLSRSSRSRSSRSSLLDTTISSIAESDATGRSHEELDKLVSEVESTTLSSSRFKSSSLGAVGVLKGIHNSSYNSNNIDNDNDEDRSDINSISSTLQRRVTFWDGYKKKVEELAEKIENNKSSPVEEQMYSSPVPTFGLEGRRTSSWSDRIKKARRLTIAQCNGESLSTNNDTTQWDSTGKSTPDEIKNNEKSWNGNSLSEEKMKPSNNNNDNSVLSSASNIRKALFTERDKNFSLSKHKEDEKKVTYAFADKYANLNYKLTSTLKHIKSTSTVESDFSPASTWDDSYNNGASIETSRSSSSSFEFRPKGSFLFDTDNNDDFVQYNNNSSFENRLGFGDGGNTNSNTNSNTNTNRGNKNNKIDEHDDKKKKKKKKNSLFPLKKDISPKSVLNTSWFNRTEETDSIMNGVRDAFDEKRKKREDLLAAKRVAAAKRKIIFIKEDDTDIIELYTN